jgi:hypothetical protein
VVPLTAALIAQRQRGAAPTARWLAIHLGFVAAALLLAYCTMTALYSIDLCSTSPGGSRSNIIGAKSLPGS